MPKSFIKIKPVKSYSEKHNERVVKPKYLIQPMVENLSISTSTISKRLDKIKTAVKEKTGRTMQKKATPIREAVILLPDDNNKLNKAALINLSNSLKDRFGIEAFQIHIHNDEGHQEPGGAVKYNYHAHIVFDWMNHETGKSYKLTREDMSEMQTMTAELLSMERGLKGSKNLSLTHREYRGYMTIKDVLLKQLKINKLSEKEDKSIRKAIIDKRNNGDQRANQSETGRTREKNNKRSFKR